MEEDNTERLRRIGEESARRLMAEKGIDGTRIFDISSKIREVMDTADSKELAFLHGMLDAALSVLPHVYQQAKENESGQNDDLTKDA
jgi:hypothetical protein